MVKRSLFSSPWPVPPQDNVSSVMILVCDDCIPVCEDTDLGKRKDGGKKVAS